MRAAAEPSLDRAEKLVREIGIPPCPAILTRLLREVRADEPDFQEIGAVVGSDVGLAALLLKTVNSPCYGLARPVASVQQALALLGARTVVQLVTGLLLRQAFPAGGSKLESFWDTSASIAQLCAQIARQAKAGDPDVAHTFGLLRDAGKALMLRRYRDYAEAETAASAAGRRIVDAENEHYGTNHARAGSLLAASWFLPRSVCAAVQHHHGPDALAGRSRELDAAGSRLVALAALAERAHWMTRGERPPPEVEQAARFAGLQLRIDEAALGEIARRAEAANEPA
jgi:HD-like signal output (HDOD) protein